MDGCVEGELMSHTTYLIIEIELDRGNIVCQTHNEKEAQELVKQMTEGAWKGFPTKHIYLPIYTSSMRFTTPAKIATHEKKTTKKRSK